MPENRQNIYRDPVRELLCSVREARFNADRCRRRLAQMEAQCQSLTSGLIGMPGGGHADPRRDGMWAALADQKEQLRRMYEKAVRQELEVEQFISRLPDDTHRILLRLRYVDLLSWPQVWEQMRKSSLYYSERQIYRIHGEALQEARKLWTGLHTEEGDDQ